MTTPASAEPTAEQLRDRLLAALPHEHWCHHDMDCCGCTCEDARALLAEPLVPAVADLLACALAAAVTAEREKYLRVAELCDRQADVAHVRIQKSGDVEGQWWHGNSVGNRDAARRIREVSR